jgi:hypothetical protein
MDRRACRTVCARGSNSDQPAGPPHLKSGQLTDRICMPLGRQPRHARKQHIFHRSSGDLAQTDLRHLSVPPCRVHRRSTTVGSQ